MLKQNLNDQCFSMANIFSFAEKVIPDFKNKSEGDKFLSLYCITAKLLSNRLYDNESTEDKIKCLLSRIPKDKEKDAEQLKSALNDFVEQNKFSEDNDYYSAKKVRSFFDTNKNLLTSIYGNEKPTDLLFFFAQMRSKKMFTNDDHRQFFEWINEATIENKTFGANSDSYWLDGKVVDKDKISNSLKSNLDRYFNEYIGEINKKCGLNINILEGDEYKTRGFKLEKRNYNEEWTVSYGKPSINNKKNYKSKDEYISLTLDIDKILKEKFGFKKINEMSKDELGKLNLSYDEEFIYFLFGCDLGNEVYLQNKSRLKQFKAPDVPFKNIKPETILKIYNYFDGTPLNKKTIEDAIKQVDDPKNLFDACDKIEKESKKSFCLRKYNIVNLYFGKPVQIDKVFKYIDQLDTENLKNIDHEIKEMVFDFLDKALNDNNQNVDALLSKFLQTGNDGGNLLFQYICDRISKNDGAHKFENYLSKIFEHYKNTNYDLTKKQKVGYLIICVFNNQYNSKAPVADPKQYINIILDLFDNGNKVEVKELHGNTSLDTIDVTNRLKTFLELFIAKYLDAKKSVLPKSQENNKAIAKIDDYCYNLRKIFGAFKESYDPQLNKNGYGQDDIKSIQSQLEFYTRILNSSVVKVETKNTILKLARYYLRTLEQSNKEFADSQFQIYLNEYQNGTKASRYSPDDRQNLISRKNLELSQAITDLKLKIRTLDIKSNVTSYFKENWTTWLSFLLIVPIFLYNFKWKPQYISTKTDYENDREKLESKEKELQNFDYVNTNSGKNHKELIDKLTKFIDDEESIVQRIVQQQEQQQNEIIPNNEGEEIEEEEEDLDLDL